MATGLKGEDVHISLGVIANLPQYPSYSTPIKCSRDTPAYMYFFEMHFKSLK